jgi:hypothetical protein
MPNRAHSSTRPVPARPRPLAWRALGLFALLTSGMLAATGCAAGDKDESGTPVGDAATDTRSDDAAAGDTDPVSPPDDGGLVLDGQPEVGPAGACATETQQVYTVAKAGQLYRFEPAAKTFKQVGTLDCAAGTATPFSMAVSRDGFAWILYNDGHLFRASTTDAKCSATSYVPDQKSFHTFGMAFVSDVAGGTAETLFVADATGLGLGKIDLATLKLTTIGTGGETYVPGELTGRSDGKLLAFFQRTPYSSAGPRIVELDKATGKFLSSKNVPSVDVGLGFAFAHWGGDYWLFTAPTGTTTVTDFSWSAGTSTEAVHDAGFKVVGAGVSTCAPLVPPA